MRDDDRAQSWIFVAKSLDVGQQIVRYFIGIERQSQIDKYPLPLSLQFNAGTANLLGSAVDAPAERACRFLHQSLAFLVTLSPAHPISRRSIPSLRQFTAPRGKYDKSRYPTKSKAFRAAGQTSFVIERFVMERKVVVAIGRKVEVARDLHP